MPGEHGLSSSKEAGKPRARKYDPELMVQMFRRAAKFRNEMKDAGFSNNGGAIHSAERILNILGMALNYPDISHIHHVRRSKQAVFSVEALEIHKGGGKVFIEHISPLRHLTQQAIQQIDSGVTDLQFKAYIRKHYRLVLLSPSETQRLNKINRSKMTADRLAEAEIILAANEVL